MTDPRPRPTTAARAAIRGARLFPALVSIAATLLALAAPQARADAPPKDRFPTRAPLEAYLMPRDAEIALARSAGPESVTKDAEVLVLTDHGYETAVPGHNGYVCVVERLWTASSDDAEFWNPRGRGPICFNPAGARYCVPLLKMRTALFLAGKSKEEIVAAMQASYLAGEFPPLENGAMCFMLSKQGHLNDAAGHWHPHLMFYGPVEAAKDWGTNLPGSPVVGGVNDIDHVTIFMVPVRKWSDGTSDIQPNEVCDPAAAAGKK
ncbi:MAG TPA: hypothetical protein VL200_16955 [Lacunisphaera sp.]|jgi:hypothetical protein|nr:hypothetical protein [Lacunisphaera sp.]